MSESERDAAAGLINEVDYVRSITVSQPTALTLIAKSIAAVAAAILDHADAVRESGR